MNRLSIINKSLFHILGFASGFGFCFFLTCSNEVFFVFAGRQISKLEVHIVLTELKELPIWRTVTL